MADITTTTLSSNDLQQEEDEEHEVLMAKVGALFSMFVLTMLVGGVPFALDKCFKWTTTNKDSPRTTLTIQCLLHFGGGVLLCTTFVHLLPEVEGICQQLFNCGIIEPLGFALAETVMCAGFFLMYIIEECVHACLSRHHIDSDETKKVEKKIDECASTCSDLPVDVIDAQPIDYCYTIDAATSQCPADTAIVGVPVDRYVEPPTEQQHGHSHLPAVVVDGNAKEASVQASLRGALLVFALSIHELFEGLSIGLEETPSGVWLTAAAISVHKLVLAFCVGMELLVSGMRPIFCLLYMFIFAVVSPIGISIGIGITAAQDTVGPTLTSAILQGIACGTLVYVVFFEIVSTKHLGFATCLSLLVGFCVMFGLLQIGEDDDDDTCGNISGTSSSAYTVQTYVFNMRN